jgi:hypothetical protein
MNSSIGSPERPPGISGRLIVWVVEMFTTAGMTSLTMSANDVGGASAALDEGKHSAAPSSMMMPRAHRAEISEPFMYFDLSSAADRTAVASRSRRREPGVMDWILTYIKP